ncbi:MAG TPA: type II toxin-antitoxin system HicB family antitoxin [Candidatus Paceibacterota bacterium]|nr:type II toxin-antitoxin system HicB family antitoxin [Candidatus Paceibacterota bacterium]
MKRTEKVKVVDAQYLCAFLPNREGGYSVRCAAFPELVTNGKTLAEARAMAREALELCIEVYQDEGRRLPPPAREPRTTIREFIPVKMPRRMAMA